MPFSPTAFTAFIFTLFAMGCAIAVAPLPTAAVNRAGVGDALVAAVSPSNSPTCSPSRPHGSGTSVETIETSFGTRSYRLHVPTGYTGSAAVPLVLNFHGLGSNATDQESYSGLSTRADQPDGGFIAVYPQGVTTAGLPQAHWNVIGAPSPEPDDVAFVRTLLSRLFGQLCVDVNRVYSTGMSNGAEMSVTLACNLSTGIAAVAPVAGAFYPPLKVDTTDTCPDTRAVPFIAFHGTADAIIPYNGGVGSLGGSAFRLPIDEATPAEDVLADWAVHNGCTGARQVSAVSAQVDKISYDTCGGDATVELYRVNGGGHTWPDATDVPWLGKTTHEINATNLIWSFFQAHPMGPPKAAVGGIAGPPDLSSGRTETLDGSSSRRGFAASAALAVATAAALAFAACWLRGRRSSARS